eukprot:5322860-Pyramimonas_sp.AAC.1
MRGEHHEAEVLNMCQHDPFMPEVIARIVVGEGRRPHLKALQAAQRAFCWAAGRHPILTSASVRSSSTRSQ